MPSLRWLLVVAILGAFGPTLRAGERDSAPAPRDSAAVAALITQATERALAGDWRSASKLLSTARDLGATDADVPASLAKGVAKWDAPPTVTIETPADGTVVATREVAVRGKLVSGRKSDVLTVNGEPVKVGADGSFGTLVRADPMRDDMAIKVVVVDEDTERLMRRIQVALRLPWAALVREAVDLGLQGEVALASAKMKEARTLGADDQDFPEPLRAGVAALLRSEEQEQAAKVAGVPVAFENSLGMRFVLIPGGTFLMGSSETERGRNSKEAQHSVTLTRPYYLATTEVTQAVWEAVMESNPSDIKGPSLPVTDISWNDAQEFLRRLNVRVAGGGYRLPTEAEWERACRAGTATRWWAGDADDALARVGWFDANSGYRLHTVGELLGSPWGLYDMHGNVWEWCQDMMTAYPSRAVTDPLANSPSGFTATSGYRVLRGGSFRMGSSDARAAARWSTDPDTRGSVIGFRPARAVILR